MTRSWIIPTSKLRSGLDLFDYKSNVDRLQVFSDGLRITRRTPLPRHLRQILREESKKVKEVDVETDEGKSK